MKFLQTAQCTALQLVLKLGASFMLVHVQAVESTFPREIQRWLNRRDYSRRFLRQKVEIRLCFESRQALSDHFSRGRHWGPEKNVHITGKHGLNKRQSTPRMMGRDKIMSPLLYKQKALPQKKEPLSAKGSLILALLSMKWDWKMVLNGLLNWRNDVLWSFPPKPPLETGIVFVKRSPESQVIMWNLSPLDAELSLCSSFSCQDGDPLGEISLLLGYFIHVLTCRRGRFMRVYKFQTQIWFSLPVLRKKKEFI